MTSTKTLTSRQRKFLEREAQPISPLVQIGGAGLTEEQISQIQRLISEHELIKVKFNDFKEEKKELSSEIAEKTESVLVRIIGNTAIFYKPAKDQNQRKFEKQLLKE